MPAEKALTFGVIEFASGGVKVDLDSIPRFGIIGVGVRDAEHGVVRVLNDLYRYLGTMRAARIVIKNYRDALMRSSADRARDCERNPGPASVVVHKARECFCEQDVYNRRSGATLGDSGEDRKVGALEAVDSEISGGRSLRVIHEANTADDERTEVQILQGNG